MECVSIRYSLCKLGRLLKKNLLMEKSEIIYYHKKGCSRNSLYENKTYTGKEF